MIYVSDGGAKLKHKGDSMRRELTDLQRSVEMCLMLWWQTLEWKWATFLGRPLYQGHFVILNIIRTSVRPLQRFSTPFIFLLDARCHGVTEQLLTGCCSFGVIIISRSFKGQDFFCISDKLSDKGVCVCAQRCETNDKVHHTNPSPHHTLNMHSFIQ